MSNRSATIPPNSIRRSRGIEESMSISPAMPGEARRTALQDSATYQTWLPTRDIDCPTR
jgi:hypothetical protein